MGKKEHKNYNLRSPVKEERTIHTILTDQLGIWDLRVELERARDAQVLSFSVSDCPCHDQVKLFVKKENIGKTIFWYIYDYLDIKKISKIFNNFWG